MFNLAVQTALVGGDWLFGLNGSLSKWSPEALAAGVALTVAAGELGAYVGRKAADRLTNSRAQT